MSDVSVMQEVPVSAESLRHALEQALTEMSRDSHEGRVSLSAPVGRNPTAKAAEVSVPVKVTYDGKAAKPLHLEALANGAFFPRFAGVVTVQPMSPARSIVHLQGQYNVPGGMLGETLDKAALGRFARHSLISFLSNLVDAARERIARDAFAAQQSHLS
jgi:hypothetical protein